MKKPSIPLLIQIFTAINQTNITVGALTFENTNQSSLDDYTKNDLLYAVYWLESNGYILRQDSSATLSKKYRISPQGKILLADILNENIRSIEDLPN